MEQIDNIYNELIEEIWKIIEDFPNYEISSFGNIRNRKANYIMKLRTNCSGYMTVSLTNSKTNKSCQVHRLVAKTFIQNPYNKPTVNHIDRNKSNNNITNLEWATMSEQNYHAALTSKKHRPLFYKPVCKIDTQNESIVESYKSVTDAALWIINNNLTTIKEINLNNISIISSKICAVSNNKRTIAYGYKWKYIDTNQTIENEIWKEIPFEIINISNYFVSNFGRYKNKKGEIKTDYTATGGYIRVRIANKKWLLHRLVALTFLENPDSKEMVNHKDGNKLNNSLDNLEWVTCSENNLHKIASGLSNCTKKVIQYDSNMNKIQEYISINECSKKINIRTKIISDNCRGKTQSTKCGYVFRYS